MQRPIFDDVYLEQFVRLAENTNAVKSVDNVADFKNVTQKVGKLQRLVKVRAIDENIYQTWQNWHTRVWFSMFKQKMFLQIQPIRTFTLEFNVKLLVNQYINLNSVHTCVPVQIKSKTNNASDIDPDMLTVYIFLLIG